MTDSAAAGPLFRNPEYLKIWLIGLFCGVVRWLELLAFGVFAVDATGSPTLVALLVILRFLPLALFGVLMGALSDLVSPRRLLILGLALIGGVAAAMCALFALGAAGYAHVAAAAFAAGVFWAGDLPIRRKMIGDRVAGERLAAAMAIDGATSNGTRMLGPLVGGALYVGIGMTGVFALGAACYAAALGIALTLGPAPGAAPRRRAGPLARLLAPFAGAAEAARYSLRDPDILRIFLVTIVFNIWGFPYLSMVPVIGKEELGLTSDVIGRMMACEGAMALFGALWIARRARAEAYRRIYLGAVAGVFLAVLCIGLVPGFWTMVAGLALCGFLTACFAAMQSTLIYAAAPAEMRGRLLGLMTICIGAGVIGFANIGLTAEAFGASNALWITAAEGLPIALALAWRWPALARGSIKSD